jgi:sterol desaturase/sphingolipid hydroxylase (fatty acid hydroxylase superfamily)
MPHRETPDRGLVAAITFLAALLFALVTRGNVVVGLVVLFLVFVPLERVFALHPRRVFRPGIVTDLTHLLANSALVTAGTIALVIVGAIPLLWLRTFDLEGALPAEVSLALAVVVVSIANYWGHRLTHAIPFLWRFHSVHHSIELMDWTAAARLHPIDAAFTQAFTVLPLVVFGYDAGAFASVAVVGTLLAIFQHANVRLRFPGLRWVVNTPEWHHWHHARDAHARDRNFGLPAVDKLFGTAYLPKDRRPVGFGIDDPVPATGYLAHLAYPFTFPARGRDPRAAARTRRAPAH